MRGPSRGILRLVSIFVVLRGDQWLVTTSVLGQVTCQHKPRGDNCRWGYINIIQYIKYNTDHVQDPGYPGVRGCELPGDCARAGVLVAGVHEGGVWRGRGAAARLLGEGHPPLPPHLPLLHPLQPGEALAAEPRQLSAQTRGQEVHTRHDL